MAGEQPIVVIDIWPGKNLWRAPDYASCFGIELEGLPPSDEMQRREQIVVERRKAWTPDEAAWRQLQEITNAVVRRRVLVSIWDSILVMLGEDEGPHPIRGFCASVETRLDETGVMQAYLRLEHPQVIPVPSGFDATWGRERAEDGSEWINLGELHRIQVLPPLVEA